MTSRKRRIIPPVAALAAVALLVGCTEDPGAAATVDGDVITQQGLAQVHAAFVPIFVAQKQGQSAPGTVVSEAEVRQEVPAGNLLRDLITAELIFDVAEEFEIGATEQEAQTLVLDPLYEQFELKVPEAYPDALVRYSQAQVVRSRVQASPVAQAFEQALAERTAEVQPQINPRYGTWDSQVPGGAVAPYLPEWILPTTEDEARIIEEPVPPQEQ